MNQAHFKQTALKTLLTAAMILALLLAVSLSASAAGTQHIEQQSDWLSVQPLDADGAVLTIDTTESPADGTEIKVTAPEGSVVTIIGQEDVTYHNVQIFVYSDNITLQLVNLHIAAPDVRSGLNRPGISIRGDADSATIHVTGSCSVQGGNKAITGGASGGVGIDATFQGNKGITIEGPGTLDVTGGNGGSVNGGYAIDCGDLTINAPITAQGGGNTDAADEGYSGGSGLYVRGNLTVNARLEATGGDAPNYVHQGNAGIDCMKDVIINADVIARGGNGAKGGHGMFAGNGSYTITENGSLTVYGGEGLTGTGGDGFFGDGRYSENQKNIEINGDFTAIGGKGQTTGGDGVYGVLTSYVFTAGTSVIQGGEGPKGGRGIFIYSSSGNTPTIEINGADVTASGAYSDSSNDGHGVVVNRGNLVIKSGTLNATGGDSGSMGANAIYAYYNGSISIEGGTVNAVGGDGEYSGGSGIRSDINSSLRISDGTIDTRGGSGLYSGDESIPSAGSGIYSGQSLSISGGEITASAGTRGSSAYGIHSGGTLNISNAIVYASAVSEPVSDQYSKSGIYVQNTFTVETGSHITAVGANASDSNGGDGISIGTGSFEMTGGEVVTSGGVSTQANGGRGLLTGSNNGNIVISGGTLTALGGDGKGFGGHAIMSTTGDITIKTGANVTALGGTGGDSRGGVGIRAIHEFYNQEDVENPHWEYLGKTITIANDAGEVYILGGLGAENERRPSIMADIVYIATGSVGEIVFEDDAANKIIKNIPGGDDIHMLTVFAQPQAAIHITSDVSAEFILGYRYLAPAADDGTVYMWLPLGEQTVSSPTYGSASGTVLNTNDAEIYLNDTVAPLLTNGAASRSSSEAATVKFTASEAGMYGYIVSNTGDAAPADTDIQAVSDSRILLSGENILNLTGLSGSGAKTIYIMGVDAAGNWSTVLSVNIPYYDSGSSSSSSGGGTTRYTIKFESNGGSSVSSQSVARNAKLTEPTAPTRAGYIFMGWYADKELTAKYDFAKAVTSSFTLYAGWERTDEEPTQDETFDYPAYISGYADGTFRPGSSLTRAEAASLFYGLMDSSASAASYVPDFSDAAAGTWYYDSVMELARRGIIGGYSDGSFKPEATITRAEFVAMALRYAGIGGESKATAFSDVAESHWAADLISAAVSARYVSGYPDNSFRPEATVARAEAVTILNRVTNRTGLASGTSFSDVPQSHWAYEAITSAATDYN